MKKSLWIKDYEEFWKIFNKERRKRREKLRRLSFAKKIEIVSRMQRITILKRGRHE